MLAILLVKLGSLHFGQKIKKVIKNTLSEIDQIKHKKLGTITCHKGWEPLSGGK